MTVPESNQSTPRKPLRVWPGVVVVAVQWLIRFGLPIVAPNAIAVAVIGGLACGLAVMIWWLFFSRARWIDRVGALILMVVGMAAGPRILDPSVRTGMMGLMFFVYAIPVLSLAFVAWAVVTLRLADGPRRWSMAATILLACAVWGLVRTNGMTGEANSDFAWRWTPTSEARLLAKTKDAPTPLASLPPAALVAGDWPGFRGPDRNGVLPHVRIDTNWSASPPVKLWRRPVGPGWSSFAVHGELFYTQEQRGDSEVVTCYKMSDGEPVWAHRDAARFWESNAGPGPRGTPTLSGGRVYTFGATGIVNTLNATNGEVVWSQNAGSDAHVKVPGWGFASSPLVEGDNIIVSAAGELVAYDRATGRPRWFGPTGGWGYSSPHSATIHGVKQVLLLNGAGAISVSPADGALLWEHKWSGDGIVQPTVTTEGDVLIGTGSGIGAGAGVGIRRIAIEHGPNGWTTKERWRSIGLKPYFNDFVVHAGCAFGFDGSFLACIDLKDGQRKWKGGRYGYGQLLLLPDQDLLLTLSEQGDVALVKATPDEFSELARFPAIKGKTWNHPALAGGILLVRNDQEMAAFQLAVPAR